MSKGHAKNAQKHRHDVGHPDHSAEVTEPFTRAIQGVLAACILSTIALVGWTVWVAG